MLLVTAVIVVAVVVIRVASGDGSSTTNGGSNPYGAWFTCSQVDVSAAVAILPLTDAEPWENPRDDRREVDTVEQIDCTFDLSQANAYGTIWIRTVIAEQAGEAAAWQSARTGEEALAETSGTIEDLDGPWQEGVLALGIGREPTQGRTAAGAEICVLDHNLQLCVRFHYASPPDPPPGVPTDQELAEATRRIVESIMVLAR